MRQRRSLSVHLLATSLLTMALGAAGFAQQANSHTGTWHLNVARSTYRPGPAPKSAVLKVEYKGNTRRSVLDTVTADGSQAQSEYTAAEDGKDYPIKGSPNADTVSLRRTGPTTIERTDKRRGQVVMFLVLRLSADGKTLTITQKGITAAGDMVSNTMVYEKR